MKKLLFLFLCLPIFLNAQDWNPINLLDKYNYQISSTNYISNTIWVDSLNVVNNDSVFYLNRIVKECPTCDPNPFMFIIANQGQFLNKKMIKKPDGFYCFEGESTFCMDVLAELDETWIFDSTQNIEATIINVSEENIFGNLDSIKTVLLSNNDTIIYSKNHGIIQFAGYGENYSLKGIEGRNIGEITPENWEFYDFEVGDVFQYRFVSSGFSGTHKGVEKVSILDKIENDTQIVYLQNVIKRDTVYLPLGGISYMPGSSYDYDMTIYKNEVGPLDGKYKNELVINEGWEECYSPSLGTYYRVVNLLKNSDTGRISKGTGAFPSVPNMDPEPGYVFLDNSTDTLVQMQCFDFYSFFTTELGRVYYYEEILDNYGEKTLIAYIKGGDTTGIIIPDEVLLLSNEEPEKQLGIDIRPNISSGLFTIYFQTKSDLRIELINLNGRIVYRKNIDPLINQLDIDLRNEPPGIYFLKANDGQSFKTYKLVKF